MAIAPASMDAFAADGGDMPEDPAAMEGGQQAAAEQDEGLGKYADLIPILEENAGDIEDSALGLPEGIHLTTLVANADYVPDTEAIESVQDAYDSLEDVASFAMKALRDASHDDCIGLAEHLANEGLIEDPDQVAVWLCILASNVLPNIGEDESDDGESDDMDSDANESMDDAPLDDMED